MGVLTVLRVGLLAALLASCAPAGGSIVVLADGAEALRFGSGTYGVVVVPGTGESAGDWGLLAEAVADNSMIVLVLPAASVASLDAARAWLTTDGGAQRVAVVTSADASGVLLDPGAMADGFPDQIIAVSSNIDSGDLPALGVQPKLFVAAEGDQAGADAAVRMAEATPGDWNLAAFVSGADAGAEILDSEGADELISVVVARLNERR